MNWCLMVLGVVLCGSSGIVAHYSWIGAAVVFVIGWLVFDRGNTIDIEEDQ